MDSPSQAPPPGVEAAPPPPSHAPDRHRWKVLALAALGIVFGDIGTSPLYALRECFHADHGIEPVHANVLGVLSLIFWSLTLIISLKYVVFILRADNHGEGGILALAALLTPREKGISKGAALVISLGLLGAAFLYADSMITPAISVLSAVEGLHVATHAFDAWVEVIAVVILIALFRLQSRGTARVGALFGPAMLTWFAVLALLGLWHIAQGPGVLAAINPLYAWNLLTNVSFTTGCMILGAVFLSVTGGEAMYADVGHFGIFPIRVSWYGVVLPSLVINYFGQGSLLMRDASATVHPLFEMVPQWALYPMILIAMMAAVMASQAVITGAFSLTLQAIQLGYCPRLRIEHTSHQQIGQIYIPAVNRVLMIASIALVLGFHSSSNLAAAYGVAIAFTMTVTTTLFFFLIRDKWKWSTPLAVAFALAFLTIDFAFLVANLLKIPHGGWFPLVVAGSVFVLMSTWRDGRKLLAARLRASMLSTELFVADLMVNPPKRVEGTAVFMAGNPMGTPLALRQNVAHNHILHERCIILGVQTAERPYVDPRERIETEEIGEGFYRATMTYGFMEEPDVPRDLAETLLKDDPQSHHIGYYLGRETLLSTGQPGMALWRESIFAFMSRNAQPATLFFHLPADRVVEIGAHVEL